MDASLLQQLTPSQKRAVCHRDGPLLVLAGPGSGKTRVITFRIACLIESGVRPHNICAITFTNKAAEEMRQRAASLGASSGAYISTFHSLCVRVLRRYADAAGINPNFSIYDDADQTRCVKQAIADCNLDSGAFAPGRMLEAISTLKNKLIDPDAFKEQAVDYFSQALAKVYARYQKLLAERHGVDFDDLLMKVALLLEGNATVCKEMAERFQYLLIDEYQDTNHAQYRLAKAIAVHHRNICATGDPDQSIYRWRGADIRNILVFEKDWPEAVTIRLEENFRSTAPILRAADRLIACNRNRKPKSLIPTRTHEGRIVVQCYADEAAEADGVGREVRSLLASGVSGRDIAVFYRINSMSRALEEAFIRHRTPYQVVRGVEFYCRKEIRDILAYLKVLVNPADEIALLRIINTPARGIGKVTVERVQEYASAHGIPLFDAMRNADSVSGLGDSVKTKLQNFVRMMEAFAAQANGKVAPLMEKVFTATGLEASFKAAGPEGQASRENIEELISTAAVYDKQSETPSLVDYLQQIALFSDADAYDSAGEKVALMTLHAAKGLEFEHAFVIGLEHGILPHERSHNDPEELEEERRLFFVGMTRAKTNLYLSYAQYRTIRGQFLRTIPSQFLYELGSGLMPESVDRDDCSLRPLRVEEPLRRTEPLQKPLASKASHQSRPAPYEPGQLVKHKTFGLGRVKKFVDMGANSVVTISFNSGQTKSLLLQYADLTKM
ncbi:MAG: UvrD-helicase domain-containing protein [Phycisphaerae bacterium]|nr:UvrD-helicase domain-containing protein [Phycisphaerae bacterium]HON90161.1 UvrD-helicase domain-containing protein [Sedimentisphaerales bacterium]